MKVKVFTSYDDHDCDTCGASYASGYVVVDSETNEIVLTLEPIASCFGGSDYTIFDLLAALQNELPELKISDIDFDAGEWLSGETL